MQKKLLPLLLLPVLALASCGGGPSTGTTNTATTNTATNTNTGTNTGTAVGSSTTTPGSTPTPQAQDAGSQSMSAEESQLLAALNEARAQGRVCGTKQMPAAAPVTWNGHLADAARGHALDMAVNGYFAHVSPTAGSLDARVNAAGYNGWKEIAENIAAGQSVSTVMNAWLQSTSHCETLMDGALKEVGIGYVYRPGSKYGTYFVEDFGTR